MFLDRSAQKFGSLVQIPVGFSIAQGLIGFQRELAVNHDVTRWVRQMDQAIRPVAVRQSGLQSIAVTGQGLGDDIVELDLTISATRLFVGQNIL